MSDARSDMPPPAPRRRWPRRVAIVVLVLLGLVAAAPYLFRIGPVRSAVLRLAFRDLNGTVVIGRAPLGWGSPIRLYGVEVHPEAGPPLVQIPAIEGNVPLWRLVVDRQALGKFTVRQPLTQIVVTEHGPNFEHLFPSRPRDPEEIRRQKEQLAKTRITVALEVAGGRLSWQGPKSPHAWEVGPMNLALDLERSPANPDAAPLLVIRQGKVLERVEISPEMCRDILQYAAPALAGVSRAQGAFSLELDESKLPLDMPEQGDLSGRFTIHRVQTSPSPLVQMIRSTVRLTAPAADGPELPRALDDEWWLELANESVVSFEMHDGRVFHRDLKFGLGNFQVETTGSVGVTDESLDLVARIHLPGDSLVDRPFLHALSEQTLVLPIKGTLKQPRVDAKGLGQSSLQALLGALDAALADPEQDPAQLEQDLADSGLVGEGALVGEGGLVDEEGNLNEESLRQLIEQGTTAARQMADWWKKRREERQADEGESSGEGLFERLRRRRGGEAPDAEDQGPVPEGEAATGEAAPTDEAPAADEETGRRRGGLFEGLRRRRRGETPPPEPVPTPAPAPEQP